MWKFEFGHPKTSAVTQTVLATQAQVTAAGLTLDLDVWGGCKKASWAGLTVHHQGKTFPVTHPYGSAAVEGGRWCPT